MRVSRLADGAMRRRGDQVAAEVPLEIRLELGEGDTERKDMPVAVTMRTPGDDFELAVGFLLTEGVVAEAAAIGRVRYCGEVSPQEYNVVTVTLTDPSAFDPASLSRNFFVTSSCGVCGKASLEAVEQLGCQAFTPGPPVIASATVRALPESLRTSQAVFDRTGGIHAAAAFSPDGTIEALREDVGRHNAVDKVVGALTMHRRSAEGLGIVVSGRASFEIMQKAAMARIATVVAVGAPSSLAVDFAKRFGMTLVGFASSRGFNVYSGRGRLGPSGSRPS